MYQIHEIGSTVYFSYNPSGGVSPEGKIVEVGQTYPARILDRIHSSQLWNWPAYTMLYSIRILWDADESKDLPRLYHPASGHLVLTDVIQADQIISERIEF